MTSEHKIQQKIATTQNQSLNQVVLVTRSIFEFVKYQIESGEHKPVRIPKWGLFDCKPERLKKLEEKGLL